MPCRFSTQSLRQRGLAAGTLKNQEGNHRTFDSQTVVNNVWWDSASEFKWSQAYRRWDCLISKKKIVFLFALLTWGSSHNKEFTVIHFFLQCPQDETWRSYIFKAPSGTDNLFVFVKELLMLCEGITESVVLSVEREGHRQLLGYMKFLPCLSFWC